VLQGGWAIGYFLAAIAYRVVVPSFGWRPLFWLAAAPALLALFVRAGVTESPAWTQATQERVSPLDLLRSAELRRSAVVGSVVLGGGFFCYYSLATFYPALIKARGFSANELALLVMLFNVGMLAGSICCGVLSERVGRRFAIALFAGFTIPACFLYLFPVDMYALAVGALIGGFVGVGWNGATPSYLAEQFPTRLRGVGVGTAYHIGALVGAVAPLAVPALEHAGWDLASSMAAGACAGALLVVTFIWFCPERRGVALDASHS